MKFTFILFSIMFILRPLNLFKVENKIELITYPMDVYINGEQINNEDFKIENTFKIVAFVKSEYLEQENVYNNLSSLVEQMQSSSGFDLAIYVSGSLDEQSFFGNMSNNFNFSFPILIDENEIFLEKNEFIRSKKIVYFLLDSQNNVLFSQEIFNDSFKESIFLIEKTLPIIFDSNLRYNILQKAPKGY